MSHDFSPYRVASPAAPDAAWHVLAQQLRRRRLPAPLQHEQEDLVSEALLRAFASPPPDGNWCLWVNRIFSNVALDRLHVTTRAGMARLRSLLSSLRAIFIPVYGPLATGAVGVAMFAQVSLSPPRAALLIAATDEPQARALPPP